MKKDMTEGKSGVPKHDLFNSNTYGAKFLFCIRSLPSATIFCNTTKTKEALLLKDEVFMSVYLHLNNTKNGYFTAPTAFFCRFM